MRHNIQDWQQRRPRNGGDKRWFGLAIILVGVLLLCKKLGLYYFSWHNTWPVVLIAVGLFIGIQKRFRNNAWWILMLIGGAHMIPVFTIAGTTSEALMLPVALIIGGLAIALRSGRKSRMRMDHMQVVTSSESNLNIDVMFGGRKEIVTSKEFRGGNISTSFGGAEVNLTQADGTVQPMIINIKVFCGGVELVVPSHWEVQNEVDPVMGSVEDKRTLHTGTTSGEEKKVLILRGTCTCGGVEIKSY